MEARFPRPSSRTQAGAPDATGWHQIAQRTIVPLLGLLLTLPITLLALTTLMPAPPALAAMDYAKPGWLLGLVSPRCVAWLFRLRSAHERRDAHLRTPDPPPLAG